MTRRRKPVARTLASLATSRRRPTITARIWFGPAGLRRSLNQCPWRRAFARPHRPEDASSEARRQDTGLARNFATPARYHSAHMVRAGWAQALAQPVPLAPGLRVLLEDAPSGAVDAPT